LSRTPYGIDRVANVLLNLVGLSLAQSKRFTENVRLKEVSVFDAGHVTSLSVGDVLRLIENTVLYWQQVDLLSWVYRLRLIVRWD
jgi:hypothetical protein